VRERERERERENERMRAAVREKGREIKQERESKIERERRRRGDIDHALRHVFSWYACAHVLHEVTQKQIRIEVYLIALITEPLNREKVLVQVGIADSLFVL